MKLATGLLFALLSVAAFAQQPQTTAPLTGVNAQFVNGIAPGYQPTAGSGLTLNISAGAANCGGTPVSYAGGTLSMTGSTTNNVYLNTGSSCVPAVKTGAFTSSDIIIARVTTTSSITAILDLRTMFVAPTGGGSGTVSNCSTVGSLAYFASTGTTVGCIGADFTFSTHTIVAATSSAILDLHAAGASGFLLPGALATGVVGVTTSTGAVNVFNASSQIPGNFIANATGSTFGVIKPDGTSCTVTSGVLSCSGGSTLPGTLTSTSGPVSDPGGNAYFQFNNASGALTFDAPTWSAGLQRCYRNDTGKTGVITVQLASSNKVDLNGAVGSSTGTLVSGGVLGDAACIVASDASDLWYAYIQSGTWTNP